MLQTTDDDPIITDVGLHHFYRNIEDEIIIKSKKFMSKKWYESSTVYFNIIVTIIGVATSFQGIATFDKYAQVLGAVTVVGNIILRVWFTNQPILATPILPPVISEMTHTEPIDAGQTTGTV